MPDEPRRLGKTYPCEICGTEFVMASTTQKYCGVKCNQKARYQRDREGILEKERRQRKENPGKWNERDRDYHLRKTYGITLADYGVMFENQGGVCKVCLQPETKIDKKGRTVNLHVDHCHSSGVVRGLLCGRCNSALGHAQDSPDRLRRLAFYVENQGVM